MRTVTGMRAYPSTAPAVAVHDTLRRRAPRAAEAANDSRSPWTGRGDVAVAEKRREAGKPTRGEADIVESSATKRLPPSKDAAASLSAERACS